MFEKNQDIPLILHSTLPFLSAIIPRSINSLLWLKQKTMSPFSFFFCHTQASWFNRKLSDFDPTIFSVQQKFLMLFSISQWHQQRICQHRVST